MRKARRPRKSDPQRQNFESLISLAIMSVGRQQAWSFSKGLSLSIDVIEVALNRAERRNALGKELLAQVDRRLVEGSS